MSYMIEIFITQLQIVMRNEIEEIIRRFDGEITFSEQPSCTNESYVNCLTVEFENPEDAEQIKATLEIRGIHVEGPTLY
jgi:hypothetical protein